MNGAASDRTRGGRIKARASRGLAWTFGSNFVVKLGLFGKSVVIARILFPEDLGLLGAALLVSGVIELFSRTGFEEAIVQKSENPDGYLNSIWTFNLIRGLLLFVLTVLVAPAAGWVFKDPRVVPVVIVIAVNFIFASVANPAVVLRRRELKMFEWNVYRVSGPAVEIIVGIVALWWLRSVWGLVVGILANGAFSTAVSFAVSRRKPKLQLEWRKIRELFGFGKHVLGSGILVYLITQGDNLVVGRVAGIAALGLYKLAYGFANAPVTAVTHVLGDVLFPAYSRLQDDKRAVLRGFEITLETSAALAVAFATIVILFTPDIITVVFGAKWLGSAWALRILCVFMLFRTIGANVGPFVYGLGRPDLALKTSLVKLVLLAIIIYPLVKYFGIIGAAVATTVPSFFSTMWVVGRLVKISGWNRWEFARCLSSPALGGAAAAAAGAILKYGSAINFSTPLNLAAGVSLCAFVYCAALFFADSLQKRRLIPAWLEMARSAVTG
jgi:O-antigen/teichoic acid export membrane protein